MSTNQNAIRALRGLYQITDAGEKGFATAAANVTVPALIIFFKFFAQQRLNFKNEILAELQRLGDTNRPGISIPGTIHRGRVAIFAGMSAGESEERMILKEAALGERAAERAYQKALSRDLPEQTRALIERQYEEVRKTGTRVRSLRDDEKRRDDLRLAQSELDTRQAVQALINDGYAPNEIETIAINNQVLYEGRGATQAETILSGLVGGALWGGIMGALAGLGVVWTTSPEGISGVILTWLLTVIAFVAIGAFISGVLAFFISAGTVGRDTYQYQEIRENAQFLVHAIPSTGKAASDKQNQH